MIGSSSCEEQGAQGKACASEEGAGKTHQGIRLQCVGKV